MIEITVPPRIELDLSRHSNYSDEINDDDGNGNNLSSDSSVTSEISLDLLAKFQSEERFSSEPQNASWNPDGSDYSLNVLLPESKNEDNDDDDCGKKDVDDCTAATANMTLFSGQDSSRSSLNSSRSSMSSAQTSKTLAAPSSSSTATRKTSSKQKPSKASASSESLLGSDYSMKVKMTSKATKSKSKKSKSSKKGKKVDFITNVSPTMSSSNSTLISCLSTSSTDSTSMPKFKSKSGMTKVHFYPRVRIQRVPNRKALTQEHTEAVWYNREEFHGIRQDCYETIKQMKANYYFDNNDSTHGDDLDQDFDEDDLSVVSDLDGNKASNFCTRGLEYKTPDAYKERQHNKSQIRTVIFEEQDYQYENDMNDPEWIARLSQEQSRSCVEAAVRMAEQDAKDAEEYYLSTPKVFWKNRC